MESLNSIELKLIRSVEEIQLDTLKAFPFWLNTPEMDTDISYWSEVKPPEGEEPDSNEGWIEFPEDFSRQRLLFGDEDFFCIWTPDWIDISQKHNGLLFVVEGFNRIESTHFEFDYPAVEVHLRFKSELDRMATVRDIRENIHEQYKEKIDSFHTEFPNWDVTKYICDEFRDNLTLFCGQYPK